VQECYRGVQAHGQTANKFSEGWGGWERLRPVTQKRLVGWVGREMKGRKDKGPSERSSNGQRVGKPGSQPHQGEEKRRKAAACNGQRGIPKTRVFVRTWTSIRLKTKWPISPSGGIRGKCGCGRGGVKLNGVPEGITDPTNKVKWKYCFNNVWTKGEETPVKFI